MQLKRSYILCLLTVGLLQGGCMAQAMNTGAEGAWHERCGTANGWRFCFLVTQSTDENRIRQDFQEVQMYNGRHMIFSPWNSWNGKHWDGLVADVFPSNSIPSVTTDEQLLAWAGIWDEAQRKRDIAAGKSASSLPMPYKTRVLVDTHGRRWAFGERRSRELYLPYSRVDQVYVTPIGENGLRLEISFECSYPHPNCDLIGRMIAGARWEKFNGG